MNLQELYRKKKVSVEEALSHIKTGDVIYHSLCSTEPAALLAQVHTVCTKGIKDIHIITGMETQTYPFNTDAVYRESITSDSMFLMAGRDLYSKGLIGYIPGHSHTNSSRTLMHKKPSVAFLSVSPMDEHGYLRCSLSQIHESEISDMSRLVIVQVNKNMPLVNGDSAIHISDIDYLVEYDAAIPEVAYKELATTDKTIGGYIAQLVNDGDTIQLGMGGIADGVAFALMNKKELGIHSELFSSNLASLVDTGIITGTKKNFNSEKIICSFIYGNKPLYDMVNNNPVIQIRKASYVNSPDIIARNDNMVSINSCMTIDLTGQVNGESIGSMQYAGTGCLSDFAIGAIHSKNGRSIIALHSTAENGRISAITPQLTAGTAVSIQRNNVDYIVTEYGIASLKGKSNKDRIANIIAVAHPDFRNELRDQAKNLNLG